MRANYFSRHSTSPNRRPYHRRPLDDSDHAECEGVSVYSVSTPLTVFSYTMEEDTRVLLPFAWDFSSVGRSARNECRIISKTDRGISFKVSAILRNVDAVQKKKFRNFEFTDWEIFGVKGKISKVNILPRVWDIKTELPSLLDNIDLHVRDLFHFFIVTGYRATTSSILGKTRYGVISRPTEGSPL